MSLSKNKIVVLGTTDIVDEFREHVSTLTCGSYNQNEIGTVIIDAYQTTPPDDPHAYREIKSGFCEHFSKQHDQHDFEVAFTLYGRFFDQMYDRLDSAKFEQLGEVQFNMAFHSWIADDDMAILLYPQRCE